MNGRSSKDSLFSASLDSEELEHILRRIDENLALRPIFHEQAGHTGASGFADAAPILPDWGDLSTRLQSLHSMQAPLFVITGRNLQNQAKRLLNLPIQIFGRKQVRFNHELVDALELILSQIQGLRQQAQHAAKAEQVYAQDRAQLISSIQSLEEQLGAQNAELAQLTARVEQLVEDQRGYQPWLEQLTQGQHGQQRWLEQLAEGQHGQQRWLEQLAKDQNGHSEWINLLQRKQGMLALDLREQIAGSRASAAGLPEPRIVDPERYHQRMSAMGGAVRVNVGCGEKPLDQYINVDFREVPDVDVVADLRRLPFEVGTVAEIASAHLIEHFRQHQMLVDILPYWHTLLQPGGLVRIICPNWEAMLARLNDGRMTIQEFKLLTFGGQDYEGDDHFAMYTPQTLSDLLSEAGFARVEVLVAERMNGLCPEMEVLAYC
jgi:predicted SAM-dependent methyltransferase